MYLTRQPGGECGSPRPGKLVLNSRSFSGADGYFLCAKSMMVIKSKDILTIQASLSVLVDGRAARTDTRTLETLTRMPQGTSSLLRSSPCEQVERCTPSGGRWFCADRSEAKKLGLRVRCRLRELLKAAEQSGLVCFVVSAKQTWG